MLTEDRRVYSRLSLARSSLQCLEVITLLDRSLARSAHHHRRVDVSLNFDVWLKSAAPFHVQVAQQLFLFLASVSTQIR